MNKRESYNRTEPEPTPTACCDCSGLYVCKDCCEAHRDRFACCCVTPMEYGPYPAPTDSWADTLQQDLDLISQWTLVAERALKTLSLAQEDMQTHINELAERDQ